MSSVISDTWGHPTWPPDTNREDLWAFHRCCFVYARLRGRPQIPLGIPVGSGWESLSSSQLMEPREWFTCQPSGIYCSISPTTLWALLTIEWLTSDSMSSFDTFILSPKYRGAECPELVFTNGCSEVGISSFLMSCCFSSPVLPMPQSPPASCQLVSTYSAFLLWTFMGVS